MDRLPPSSPETAPRRFHETNVGAEQPETPSLYVSLTLGLVLVAAPEPN
jgi:hypothetical protein